MPFAPPAALSSPRRPPGRGLSGRENLYDSWPLLSLGDNRKILRLPHNMTFAARRGYQEFWETGILRNRRPPQIPPAPGHLRGAEIRLMPGFTPRQAGTLAELSSNHAGGTDA